ncbi:MAG: Gfo/Idh/MocA family oxidoreductase [Clostridiales bacterium]|nr:Gfo/Idh/MocA family oxidoreductase [Clostridiales bacterium]
MKTIQWGILSTGSIANTFAKTAAQMNGEIEIGAVASRNLPNAQAFAQTYGIKKAYGSYEQLATDPDIDIVYVATPHSRHFEDMMLLLTNGKHILCEKSFTVTADEARWIYNFAKEKNLLVIEAFWTKFLPIYRELEQRLASGVIGDIRMVTAQYGYQTSPARHERKMNPDLAGGALLDIGVYCIGFAAMILGYKPDEIRSLMHINEVGTDTQDAIILRYGNASAVLTSAIGINTPVNAVIFGTLGHIDVENFKNPQAFTIVLDSGDTERFELPFDVNGYEYQMREAVNCLNEGKIQSDIMTPKQSIGVMKIMDKARAKGGLRFPFEQG